MQKKEFIPSPLKTRFFRFCAVLLVIAALAVAWGANQLSSYKNAHAAAANIVIGFVNLNVKNNTIYASPRLTYNAAQNANIPMVFHIHLNTATGPVLYTSSISTNATGQIIADNVPMTATASAPAGTVTFPNNGTWILNFHDTTLPHNAGTPAVAVGHATVVNLLNNGTFAVASGFTQ